VLSRLTSRARRVPTGHASKARVAPARPPRLALEREATRLSRGAQDRLDRGAPRASHVASRLAF